MKHEINKDVPGIKGMDDDDSKYMYTLSETLEYLQNKGYTHEFQYTELGLKSKESNEIFKAEDIIIKKVHRFEGSSDPGDMTIVYQIETTSGVKGYYSDAFGTYGSYDEQEMAEFFRKVKRSNF